MRCFENIAKLIRKKRVTHPKAYSQSELSHLLGYKNGQFISNVERALCNIPFKMLKKVSEILEIPAEEVKVAILKDQELTLEHYLREGEINEMPKGRSAHHDDLVFEGKKAVINHNDSHAPFHRNDRPQHRDHHKDENDKMDRDKNHSRDDIYKKRNIA